MIKQIGKTKSVETILKKCIFAVAGKPTCLAITRAADFEYESAVYFLRRS